MITDLTQGKPSKMLFNLALPMVISILFQQMYNLVDSVIVGRFVGGNALYAIGSSFSLTMIFLAVATGSSVGITVVAGKFFGAKKYADLKTTVSTTFIGMFFVSIFFTLAGALLAKPILALLGTPDYIMEEAVTYLQIFFYGLLFIYMYNVVSGAFAAVGDSKTSLVFLIISSLLNIGLDLLFVCVFKMGVSGAACATLISQAVAAIPAMVVLYRRISKLESESAPWFSFTHLRIVLRVAVPSMVQHAIVSLGNLFIQGRVNYFSTDNEAVGTAYTAAIKLNTVAINCFVTIGNAVSSFTAQNLGAAQPDRVKKGCWAGILISVCVALPIVLIYMLLGDGALKLFMTESTSNNIDEIIRIGRQFLNIISPFYLIIPIKIVMDGVLRGGERMTEFLTSTFSDLVLRVVFAYILTIFTPLKEAGIWWAWPIGWVMSVAISLVFYLTGKWQGAARVKDSKQGNVE
ncbi:MAG: MATE family efflux transporter [Clostridia bacterium]|nr:MATE family efflux transporter [Clostridia bacterium]